MIQWEKGERKRKFGKKAINADCTEFMASCGPHLAQGFSVAAGSGTAEAGASVCRPVSGER